MVLCKFFQQGTCRFGSKCHNEHFDVRQVVKTDVESAINGRQWPLSTYGPFKDKPSIPNFIEDRLFEEVRLLCYEAKQKNVFEQFHSQFTKEVMEANNKMKALLQMTPEIVDVVIKCYDAPATGFGGDTQAAEKTNPFGLSVNAASSAGSIFAKPTGQSVSASSNIFGNSNFGNSTNTGSGIFGGSANSQPSLNQAQQQNSIFGQAAKTTNSIFGGASSNLQQTSNIFSNQQQQPSVITGNLFSQTQQQNPTSGSGLFTQQQQPSVFGQTQQSGNLFAQQQSGNMFSQVSVQQPQQQQNIFSQAAVPTNNGMFGQVSTQNLQQQQQGSIFAQNYQRDQSQNTFNQSMHQQQNTQAPNMFQQPQQSVVHEQPLPPSGFVKKDELQTVGLSVYSRLEDLSAEEIEAFKAETFLPGKLPCNPPPRELIN